MRVELKFTDADARRIKVALARRYGKRENCSLENLVMIAVRREVAEQAKIELAKVEKEMADEAEGVA